MGERHGLHVDTTAHVSIGLSMCIVMCANSEVGVGRSSTEPVRGGQLPEVLPAEPWDGKDGEV